MSKAAQLLVCLPSPTVADKTVLSLFFSRGQVASNKGDQTQKLHLQSLLFFSFLFYLGLSYFLCEMKARFQKGDSLTTTNSALLSWAFLETHAVIAILYPGFWIDNVCWVESSSSWSLMLCCGRCIHSEGSPHPALKSWKSYLWQNTVYLMQSGRMPVAVCWSRKYTPP